MVNWISLNTTGGTSGTSQISLTVAANNDYSARTTSLTVTTLSKNLTETVVINQAQKTATGSMAFSPSALTYTYQGGILYLNFTANTDWNVVSWPTWVGISGDGTSGSAGTYTWGVTAASNSSDARNSTFTFYCGGNYFTVPVYQEAYQASPSLSVSPTTVNNISSGGTSFNITVTSNTGWTITSYPNWVSLNVTGGSGNGAVVVNVAPNTGNNRNNSIVFTSVEGTLSASTSLSQIGEAGIDYSKEYLTFEIISGGTLYWKADTAETLEYRINSGNWNSVQGSGSPDSAFYAGPLTGTIITQASSGDIIEFRANLTTSSYKQIRTDTKHNVYGNIMSLVEKINFSSIKTYVGYGIPEGLFSFNNGLIDASNLILPATGLTNNCYNCMFYGCNSLTTVPKLPATTLVDYCYYGMFEFCSSLTTAPELPATTLGIYCYANMFSDCASLTGVPSNYLPVTTLAEGCYLGMFNDCYALTTAPALPATTLAERCYFSMFGSCTGLTSIPELPATTLAYNCYGAMFSRCTSLTSIPSNYLPATNLERGCYIGMFGYCTGLTDVSNLVLPSTSMVDSCYGQMFEYCTSLTKAPALPATTLASFCYNRMFANCTSLTVAPELPATTLLSQCYQEMFMNCSSLNYIKCLATNISARYCTSSWVSGVSSSGTFVKASGMNDWPRGQDGIPNNWTVQDA